MEGARKDKKENLWPFLDLIDVRDVTHTEI